MVSLPSEIMTKITSRLTYNEKKNLFKECHTLTKYAQLYTAFSVHHPENWNACESFFKENEPYSSQVKSLRLNNTGAKLDSVVELFQNLQDIDWTDDGSSNEEHSVNEKNSKSWNSIVSFREQSPYLLSAEILKHGGFCNLTELEVKTERADISCTVLIQELSKAPKLKILKLDGYSLSFLDLQHLHDNVPQLETLHLENFNLLETESSIQEYLVNQDNAKYWKKIVSFSFQDQNLYCLFVETLTHGGFCNLTKLEIKCSSRLPRISCSVLIQQLSKAPKLKTLKLVRYSMSLPDLKDLHSNVPQLQTLHLIKFQLEESGSESVVADPNSCRRLTELNFRVRDTDQNKRLMEYMKSQYTNVERLTIDGSSTDEVGLASMIAGFSHLAYYRVYSCPITASIVEAMDKSKAQLKEIEVRGDCFDQIKHLQGSNQKCSLEKIKMESKESEIMKWETFQGFEKLKHLDYSASPPPSTGSISKKYSLVVDLAGILTNIKHLQTLELCNVGLMSAAKDKFKSTLKTLILDCDARYGVMPFLSESCPELVDLSIRGRIREPMAFPEHHFSSIALDLHDVDGTSMTEFKVENTDKGQITRHEYDSDDYFLNSEHDLPTTSPDSEQPISIMYAHCDNLKIGKAYIQHNYL